MKKINQLLVLKEIEKSDLLKNGFKYYINYNTSISNPYHNINHTLGMMQLIIELLDSGSIDEDVDREKLLLYAMFHDFGHSGGCLDDKVNVDIAYLNIKRFLSTITPPALIDDVEILEDTIYPYKDVPKTIYGNILRECDCLQWAFEDYFTQTFIGLKTELHLKDYQEAIKAEMDFVEKELIPTITIPYLQNIAAAEFKEFLEINKTVLGY